MFSGPFPLVTCFVRIRVFRAFSSAVRQMPGQNPQRPGTAPTLPNFFFFFFIICFVSFFVFFLCICVLYYCHQVATQLQLNISYHIITAHSIMCEQISTVYAVCLQLTSVYTGAHKYCSEIKSRFLTLFTKCVQPLFSSLSTAVPLLSHFNGRDGVHMLCS
jgi:heme/copper-type cytochrome/quinol oxidase subunit 2